MHWPFTSVPWHKQLVSPGARIALQTEQDKTAASIELRVRVDGTERSIYIFWNPDECDAGAPNGGWSPTGFDWKSPQTPLVKMLTDAGNDCLKYMKQ